jgi:uncharacterized protein (TIGR03435 family)
MNAIRILSAQPWVGRFGSTLLQFLWQGILIAAVYAIARRRAASPNTRYILGCVALAVMAAAPVITWSLLLPGTAEIATVPFTATQAATHTAIRNTAAVPFSAGADGALPASFLPWVVAAWLAGAMAFGLRLIGGWIVAERLRSRMIRPAPPEWQRTLDRLKTGIRVSRPVRLLVSAVVQTPAVVGWLRPIVLVPVGALTGLPLEQIEALLLHELAHIRRHDYLVNILQSAVEALLFYHPAVWWVSGHVRAERELCCDDAAVSVTGDAVTYARALVELESARAAHGAAAMAANGGSLARRIARLLGQPREAAEHTRSGPGTIAAAMLLAVTALAVWGQPGARPKFEVASVKPSQESRFMSVRPLPGRLTANAPVRLLMQNAYTVQAFQILDGPAWINSEYYDIDATTDGNVSRAQTFLMLQSLLEDRFGLKIHRETRDLPVYTLVAAKGGSKLAAAQEGSCAASAPDGLLQSAGGRVAPPGQGPPVLTPCGGVRVMLDVGGARMLGGKIAMPEFVRTLSLTLGRTVIDKTGLTGFYDVKLDFVPDEATAALPPPPPDAAAALDAKNPSVLTALQEQLGLRLESGKGPVEVIVVDHVERPATN